MNKTETTVELWNGYIVTLNLQLLDDFDFLSDLATARNNNDLPALAGLYFGLAGGDKVAEEIRDHITEEQGYFSMSALMEILNKISDALPKAGNRAQRRY